MILCVLLGGGGEGKEYIPVVWCSCKVKILSKVVDILLINKVMEDEMYCVWPSFYNKNELMETPCCEAC